MQIQFKQLRWISKVWLKCSWLIWVRQAGLRKKSARKWWDWRTLASCQCQRQKTLMSSHKSRSSRKLKRIPTTSRSSITRATTDQLTYLSSVAPIGLTRSQIRTSTATYAWCWRSTLLTAANLNWSICQVLDFAAQTSFLATCKLSAIWTITRWQFLRRKQCIA